MPSLALGESMVVWLMLVQRAHRPSPRRSCSPASALPACAPARRAASFDRRQFRPPSGIAKSVGISVCTRNGSASIEAEDSTVSASALKPTAQPEKRDIAQPCRPSSRYSCTLQGYSTGNHGGGEQMVALVRQRRRIGAVVVARHQQHAAMLRGAGEVHVLEHVAAAIHARALAVPQGKHAVVVGLADQLDLLRCPTRRWRPVLR